MKSAPAPDGTTGIFPCKSTGRICRVIVFRLPDKPPEIFCFWPGGLSYFPVPCYPNRARWQAFRVVLRFLKPAIAHTPAYGLT